MQNRNIKIFSLFNH